MKIGAPGSRNDGIFGILTADDSSTSVHFEDIPGDGNDDDDQDSASDHLCCQPLLLPSRPSLSHLTFPLILSVLFPPSKPTLPSSQPRSRLRHVPPLESQWDDIQSQRQAGHVPVPPPPNLNERRGSDALRHAPQVHLVSPHTSRAFPLFAPSHLFSPRLTRFPPSSLITLAVQNAALSIVMHYSRVSTPPSQSYSPASAVLLNEILKGLISFSVAVVRVFNSRDSPYHKSLPLSIRHVCHEIFSTDSWKLSIPAVLYVIQNSLQFVAIGNLPVATFQVTYQMKILTTAAFSVVLLRKSLSPTKWMALCFLALGVGIVQIQSTSASVAPHKPVNIAVGSAHDAAPVHIHIMSPLKGFGAVTAACFTSGLAGVYFEMVLKGSKADLWVRNVQLSLFSLVPALLPVIFSDHRNSQGFIRDLVRNFGGWAWGTVAIQTFGGLITAVVIKYSDNILKGFATSLAIILSFLASVALFDFKLTPSFLVGSTTVLAATWMYNQPAGKETLSIPIPSRVPTPFNGTPEGSPKMAASVLGEKLSSDYLDAGNFGDTPYGSPWHSKSPSPALSTLSLPRTPPLNGEGRPSPP
jgi:UDP-sugar transporter A1/2/3